MLGRTVAARGLAALVLILVVAPGALPSPRVSAHDRIVQADDGGEPEEDQTDAAVPDTAAGAESFVTRIEAGGCDTRDANTTAFSLADAAAHGENAAGDVFVSETEIAAALTDLLARPHVIVFELDDAGLAVPVACGEITGQLVEDKVIVGLQAEEGGALVGVAVLTAVEGANATIVGSYLVLPGDTSEEEEAEDDDDSDESEGGEGGV